MKHILERLGFASALEVKEIAMNAQMQAVAQNVTDKLKDTKCYKHLDKAPGTLVSEVRVGFEGTRMIPPMTAYDENDYDFVQTVYIRHTTEGI